MEILPETRVNVCILMILKLLIVGCLQLLYVGMDISEYIERKYGKEAAKYPDRVSVIFDHRPNKVSKGHFIPSVKLLKG